MPKWAQQVEAMLRNADEPGFDPAEWETPSSFTTFTDFLGL